MRVWKSTNGSRVPGQQIPSKEVKDFLMDFGDVVHTGKSVWLTLSPKNLPSYLRGLDVTKEAHRWAMVLTRRGKLVLRFKQGNTKFLDAIRARA